MDARGALVGFRQATDEDRVWIRHVLTERWAGPQIVSRGRVHQAVELPAYVAYSGSFRLGVATYHFEDDACELVSLDSLSEKRGVGSGLIAHVADEARSAGCKRLWLVTTNDNLNALRFYQRRGFHLVALYRGALDESRRLKPGIPEIGLDGIPLRDEIELERGL